MATVNSFEDLAIWQKAQELAVMIYRLTQSNQKMVNDFSYKDQVKRAVLSISNNIAEGFEYNNNNDFIRYLRIAKGSCGEVRSCLFFAVSVGYDTQESLTATINHSKILSSQIGNLIQYLKSKKQLVTRNKNNPQPN